MKRFLLLLAAILSVAGAAQFTRGVELQTFPQDQKQGEVRAPGSGTADHDTPAPSRHHPAIKYDTTVLTDAVTELNRKIQTGTIKLRFDRRSGYLRSILEALKVPIDSQIAVFSKTSLQSSRISPHNPRMIFFNDSVAVAFPRGGFIELASIDPRQGVIFYSFGQFGDPEFRRDVGCLKCHISPATQSVPGLAAGSVYPGADGAPLLDAPTFVSDHRSPLDQRWGGWYVTGVNVSLRHLGNRVVTDPNKPEMLAAARAPNLESLEGKFDLTGYLSAYSDVVALLVFNHQAHMANLITRMGWESRVASYERGSAATSEVRANRLEDSARELVDYLFFIDEARLPDRIQGTSGFADKFQSLGPGDRKGRSLRQLDLERRLLRYPCSYMIYTAAFDALPDEVRDAIYRRMWQILSGGEKDVKYTRLSLADRRAIVEILRDTKHGLPRYFQPLMN